MSTPSDESTIASIWVIDLTYVAPLAEVDRWRDDHLAVLADFAERGVVAASGPKSPRTGGYVVTHPVPRATVDDLVAVDPFAVHGVAEYAVTALRPPVTG